MLMNLGTVHEKLLTILVGFLAGMVIALFGRQQFPGQEVLYVVEFLGRNVFHLAY